MVDFMEMFFGPNWNLVVFFAGFINLCGLILMILAYQIVILTMYIWDVIKLGHETAKSIDAKINRKTVRKETFFKLED